MGKLLKFDKLRQTRITLNVTIEEKYNIEK